MTKEEFLAEAGRIFDRESEPTYALVGSSKRSFSQDQKKKCLEDIWEIKSVSDKLVVKEKLVKELMKRNFDSKQDEADFILTFLALG